MGMSYKVLWPLRGRTSCIILLYSSVVSVYDNCAPVGHQSHTRCQNNENFPQHLPLSYPTDSSPIPRTDPAFLLSLLSLFTSTAPADYSTEAYTGYHRVTKHLRLGSVDIERPEPPEEAQAALAFLIQGICVFGPFEFIVNVDNKDYEKSAKAYLWKSMMRTQKWQQSRSELTNSWVSCISFGVDRTHSYGWKYKTL